MKFRIGNASSRSGNVTQSGGGGCLIAFGLVFAGAGLAAFVFLSKLALDEAATYQWTETPCTIESCEIEDDVSEENPFTMVVKYSYEFGGQRYESTQYTLQESRHDNYEDLALQRKAILSNRVVCHVDPENPASAVIRREGLKTGLFALFPLLFVAVGSLIIWGGIASLRKKKKAEAAGGAGGGVESISAEAKGKGMAGWKIGALVGTIFFVVGAGMLYPLAIRPISKMLKSEHWMETPCKILWSTVRRHESTDSDGNSSVTYSVDIFYEYDFNGETHRSNNYGFFGGSSSGRGGKQRIVNQYRRGSEQNCYVNPDLPEQAVLKSGLSASALFGLIPAVFVGIGALVAFGSIRSGRKKKGGGSARRGRDEFRNPLTASRSSATATATALRTGAGISDHGTGPRILKPAGSRLTKTLVVLGIALFWNGIVSVFVYQVVQGFRRGDPEWFLTIFMIPFVLVGLGLLIGFFYQLLALANPKPVITLNPGTVRLGEPFDLRWELKGSASRLTSLKLSIWGIESATYRRGTNTHTSNETFYADAFAETSHLMGMRSGAASVTIPGDLMYSFETGNNQIKYELRIEGDIPFWPDIGDHYEISVLPQIANT